MTDKERAYKKALLQILSITLKSEGPDWEEIQDAQKIAAEALGMDYKPVYQEDVDNKPETIKKIAELIRDL